MLIRKSLAIRSVLSASLSASLSAACLVGVTAGCHDKVPPPDEMEMMDTSGMSKTELMSYGENLVASGLAMKAKAAQMDQGQTTDGMDKDQIMAAAQRKIDKGHEITARANAM